GATAAGPRRGAVGTRSNPEARRRPLPAQERDEPRPPFGPHDEPTSRRPARMLLLIDMWRFRAPASSLRRHGRVRDMTEPRPRRVGSVTISPSVDEPNNDVAFHRL